MNRQPPVGRLAVMGGTFDPVHRGHVFIAEEASRVLSPDRFLLVPARVQPFKQDVPAADPKHRVAMLRLAFSGPLSAGEFEISFEEIERDGLSYTVDTLEALRAEHGPEELWFVTGADTFLKIEKWKAPERLLRDFCFLVADRPGCREEELAALAVRLRKEHGARVRIMNNEERDISSSEIRKAAAEGRSLSAWVPPEVERYIKEYGLYRTVY